MLKRLFSFRSRPKNKHELELTRFLIKKFGYRPKNISLFKTAVTHKSISNTSKDLVSNERLEFLGDTILDAIIADYLYHKFPKEDEGYLTKVKSKLVNRKTLSTVASKMGLSNHILYQKSRSIRVGTLEGNAFEAIIGAIYLDSSYDEVKKSIYHSVLRNYVDIPNILKSEIDFKSQLYIWAQKSKLTIDFKLLKEELLHGKWEYEVEVMINSTPYGHGKGSTKKLAEQEASKETLELLG